MASAELEQLADLAVLVAADAGEVLREGLERARVVVGTKSSPTDLVTEVDRRAEELIAGRLREARPDDGLLGEEGTDEPGRSGVRWIVDPLDGTTNYLYGFPAFAVSIAAEVEGRVRVGVVHDPVRDETYRAVAGSGSRGNGRLLEVRRQDELATALVGTGFAYDRERRREQAQVLTEVLPRVRDIRRAGSAALDLCWVASGRLDACYERGLAPWDFAAGALVAIEAGARVGDLAGGGASTEFVLAASPGIFDPLRDLLVTAGAGSA